MQIYSLPTGNGLQRIYGKLLGKVKRGESEYSLYEDYKGLKWLHICRNPSKYALLPWKSFAKPEQYITFLFTQ